ncbi:unnamed protein product, partial [Prorocentrum cordatum]
VVADARVTGPNFADIALATSCVELILFCDILIHGVEQEMLDGHDIMGSACDEYAGRAGKREVVCASVQATSQIRLPHAGPDCAACCSSSLGKVNVRQSKDFDRVARVPHDAASFYHNVARHRKLLAYLDALTRAFCFLAGSQ